MINAVHVAQSDGEFITINKKSGHRLALCQRYGCLTLRVPWIEHLFFQLETFKTRCDSSKIASRGVTFAATTGTIEILLTRFHISSLKIAYIDSTASTRMGRCCLTMYEDDKAVDLFIGKVEGRHLLFRSAITNHVRNLRAIHI